MNNKKSPHNFEQLTELMNDLKQFFIQGDIPVEQAYACSTLAGEYLKRMQGLSHSNDMIEFYELNPGYRPIIFSCNETIDEQIARLEDSRNALPYMSPPRHKLMMLPEKITDTPPVQPNSLRK
jgi:hypothetical protein